MKITKNEVTQCMLLTARVINLAAGNVMAQACLNASTPMTVTKFAKWLRGRRRFNEMYFALMSLATPDYLKGYSLGVKVHYVVDHPQALNRTNGPSPVAYVVRRAAHGYGGVCLAVSRHVEDNDIHIVKDLPGWKLE